MVRILSIENNYGGSYTFTFSEAVTITAAGENDFAFAALSPLQAGAWEPVVFAEAVSSTQLTAVSPSNAEDWNRVVLTAEPQTLSAANPFQITEPVTPVPEPDVAVTSVTGNTNTLTWSFSLPYDDANGPFDSWEASTDGTTWVSATSGGGLDQQSVALLFPDLTGGLHYTHWRVSENAGGINWYHAEQPAASGTVTTSLETPAVKESPPPVETPPDEPPAVLPSVGATSPTAGTPSSKPSPPSPTKNSAPSPLPISQKKASLPPVRSPLSVGSSSKPPPA
jgi:hypothetical protein